MQVVSHETKISKYDHLHCTVSLHAQCFNFSNCINESLQPELKYAIRLWYCNSWRNKGTRLNVRQHTGARPMYLVYNGASTPWPWLESFAHVFFYFCTRSYQFLSFSFFLAIESERFDQKPCWSSDQFRRTYVPVPRRSAAKITFKLQGRFAPCLFALSPISRFHAVSIFAPLLVNSVIYLGTSRRSPNQSESNDLTLPRRTPENVDLSFVSRTSAADRVGSCRFVSGRFLQFSRFRSTKSTNRLPFIYLPTIAFHSKCVSRSFAPPRVAENQNLVACRDPYYSRATSGK